MNLENPLTYLVPPEVRELVAGMNRTATGTRDAFAHELVDERLAARAAEPVLEAPDIAFTGEGLAGVVGATVDALLEAGVRPGSVVAVCMEFGWQQVPAMLAALRAGAAFHALEPSSGPLQRAERLRDVGARVVLTQPWLDERLRWDDAVKRVLLDAGAGGQPHVTLAGGERPGRDAAGSGEDRRRGGGAAACVVDGGTGGLVTLSHATLVNLFEDVRQRFAVGPGDRLLALSPATGDRVLFDGPGVLAAGASVALPRDIDVDDPARWLPVAHERQVTVVSLPPGLVARLVNHLSRTGDRLPPSLRLMLISGEPLGVALARALRALAPETLSVVYLAGRPGSGTWSLCMPVEEIDDDWKHVPAGRPMANQRVYVLGEELAQCPVWVTGRVYYAGAGLAPDTGQAAEAHVTHPETGERLYRSQDIGRLLDSGVVELLGEDAQQVMVHGHPLNARDTEAALARHEAVLLAVVAPAADGTLAAWVQPHEGRDVTSDELRAYLGRKLSPYLRPATIEVLRALPLTGDGRVDRGALAATAGTAVHPSPGDGHPGEAVAVDERIHAVAVEVLGIRRVAPDMNLIDLGATSIDLVRLATRVEQDLGVPVDVEELLRFPSLTVLQSLYVAGLEASPPEAPARSPSTDLIVDPVERQAFKDARRAVREDLGTSGVQLLAPVQLARLASRATHRRFGPGPVPFDAFGALLGSLRTVPHRQEHKYWYPSAGSAYAVQAYVSVQPGSVDRVPGGTYYYHPVRNRLIEVAPGEEVPAGTHAWINRRVAEQSAFGIYLFLDGDAMRPLYGDRSHDYALVEAGAMLQLLMMEAPEHGLGLCPVGEMDAGALVAALRLGDGHRFLHAIIGGRADPEAGSATAGGAEALARLDVALGEAPGTGHG